MSKFTNKKVHIHVHITYKGEFKETRTISADKMSMDIAFWDTVQELGQDKKYSHCVFDIILYEGPKKLRQVTMG